MKSELCLEMIRDILYAVNSSLCYYILNFPFIRLQIIHPLVARWPLSRLVCSSPDRAVRVRALAGDIVLCSWARYFTLTVPLSTQVYRWVPAILMLGQPCDELASHPGGVEIFLVASCYRNREKLRFDGPLASYADLFLVNLSGISVLVMTKSPSVIATFSVKFFIL